MPLSTSQRTVLEDYQGPTTSCSGSCEVCPAGESRIGCSGGSAGSCEPCPTGEYKDKAWTGNCITCGGCPEGYGRSGCGGSSEGSCDAGTTFPSSPRTNDWGRQEHANCVQPFTWAELIQGYKDCAMIFKTGGLGQLLEVDGYETWQCIRDHFCANDLQDPWFCFVYHETNKVFTPWGHNSDLKLVENPY